MRWSAALLVLAACSDEAPGVKLEILKGKTRADRVELYLAPERCAGCDPMIRPDQVTQKLPGEVWLLDGTNGVITPNTTAAISGGHAVFDLKSSDTNTDTMLGRIVIVGYAGAEVVGVAKLTDILVSHTDFTYYRIALAAATGAPSSPSEDPDGERVWVWKRADNQLMTTAASCVGLERSAHGTVTREWLVPGDDTDCDSIDLECDKFSYKADGTAAIEDASCLVETTIPTTTGTTCVVGGMACVDGESTDLSCGRVTPYYCVTDDLCRASASCTASPQAFINCVRNAITPKIKCTIPVTTGGGVCGLDPTYSHGSIDLSPLFRNASIPAQPPVSHCTDVKFTPLVLGPPVPDDTIMSNGSVFKLGPLQASAMNPCNFDLIWTSTAASFTGQVFSLFDLTLSNSSHVMIPLQIEFRPGGCTGEKMVCDPQIPPLDGIRHCTQL